MSCELNAEANLGVCVCVCVCVCMAFKSSEYGVSVKGTTTTPGSVKNVPIFNILDQVSALNRGEEG